MPFEDLREFIGKLKDLGELQTLEDVHWDLEIGVITEMMAERKEQPALLFDSIPGYPKGYRVFTNAMTTVRRTALALDLPLETKPLEVLRAWKEKSGNFHPIPPQEVEEAPVKENIITGDDIDLFKFPVPRWHELDPGRYMGTANCVIMKDPDGKWVNLGTYRMVIHDKKTLGLYISPGKHGYLFLQKYHERKENAPVAVSFGQDPLLFLAATTFFPHELSEYEFAGWVRGRPVKVTKGVATDLPIPATAEIVIEGEVPPKEVENRMEGPFGEWTGYYGAGPLPQTVVRVKSILFRNNPILFGAPPLKFPVEWFAAVPFNAAETWDALEKAGIPEVKGVWQFGNFPMLTVVAVKQRYAGHAKRAALVAAGAKGSAYVGRFIVVVDEDIDVTNLEDVVWAMTSRCDPAQHLDIIRDCWSSPIDPIISPYDRFQMPHGTQSTSRVLVTACKPYKWYNEFPKTNLASPQLREKMLNKYSELFSKGG